MNNYLNNALAAWLGVNALALLVIVFKAGGYITRIENLEKKLEQSAHDHRKAVEDLNGQHREVLEGRGVDTVLIGKLDVRVQSMGDRVESIHRTMHDLRNWLMKQPPDRGPGC